MAWMSSIALPAKVLAETSKTRQQDKRGLRDTASFLEFSFSLLFDKAVRTLLRARAVTESLPDTEAFGGAGMSLD
jgi:hypothetical protein